MSTPGDPWSRFPSFHGSDYDTLEDWASAHIGEFGHQPYNGNIGIITRWEKGSNGNGIWFYFWCDEIERGQYKKIPVKFKGKNK